MTVIHLAEAADHFTNPFISCPNFNLPVAVSVSVGVRLTMVTPRNVLVPPLWHFILLHHLLLSTFSISPHRNYPDYDYSCDDNDNCSKIALPRSYLTLRRLWLTERMSANVSPLVFFMLSMFLSFISFLSYLAFLYFCSLASDFSPLLSSPFVSF